MTGLGSNTGLSDEKLATNPLSHGTALDQGEWSTEVSATYSRRKNPWNTFDRKLGGPQIRAGLYREETNLAAVEKQMPIPFKITSVCQVSFSYK